MTHRVRIERKRKSNLTQSLNWLGFLKLLLGRVAAPYIDQHKATIQEAQLEKTRKDTELAEVRKQVQMNEVVLRDIKIEREKLRLELLEYEARMKGLRSGGSDWTCTHCSTVNTPMAGVCSACGARK